MVLSPEVLFYLRVADSATLLILLLTSLLLKRPTEQTPTSDQHSEITSVVQAVHVPRKQLIVLLLSLLALTAFLEGSVTVASAVFKNVFEPTLPGWKGNALYSIALLVAFAGLAILGLVKEARGVPIWQSKLLKLFIFVALVFDALLAVLIPLVPIWKRPRVPENPDSVPPVGIAPAVHFGLTVFRVLVLLILFPALFFPRTVYKPIDRNESAPQTEESSLLIPAAVAATAPTASKTKYGTFDGASTPLPSSTPIPTPAAGGSSTPAINLPVRTAPTWYENGVRLMRLVPYLWPYQSFGLQLLALVCLLILAVGRVVNAAIPFQLSAVLDALAREGASRTVLPPLMWYIGLRFFGAPGGLDAIRGLLWAPVIQFSNRSLSQLAFDHLLSLSLAWHTRRKTGEILSILDRGAAIKRIFELLIFNLVPTVADTVVAVWIFFWYFGPTLSVFITVTMVMYVSLSAMLTAQMTKLSRGMVGVDVATRGIHTDSLLNYETVKYFNGEAHEGARYREALGRYQESEIRVMASLNIMSLSQNLLLSVGLLVGSLLVVFDAAHQDEIMKRYVVFITYLAQLYGPLNTLAFLYSSINQSLIDTERLLDLLDEPSEVQDKPDAKELVVTDGIIEFDNVTFSYDGRSTALKGVSFTVPKGGSLALVGESGSGKSTILKLLYRFYDLAPSDGAIRIDGQDIRDVTQTSLRRAIGIVPQDCVLFNNTIGYNIGYGKFGSSTEEIENAARAAQIHERILSFPDGYETAVGERGVRLSGGEKQRVAIARTILKAPAIILLDEATSALDTSTERDIQKAVQNLTEGRSSVSIAHRLSTISKSDLILVFYQGEIVESGTQRELIERGGRFATMWADQMSSMGESRATPEPASQDDSVASGSSL
ncbi:ABC transporter [Rhizoctonia solani 123E]|uniref:ABC transporter n=1 Tax=Rhizoctonia solani 123E TaxID=1423351 RepID=A0A074RW14_9AGAM|nr:ABC transporter [Rhizoctonia solani 123E]